MDQIYFWILILFVMICVLDISERFFKRESNIKENFGNRWSDGISQPFYEENRLVEYVPPITTNSVNLHLNTQPPNYAHTQFSNFTTNGYYPPFLKCSSCNLQYNCSDYPYEVDEKNMNVCSNCLEKINLNDLNMPVYARANGRPRQCKDLTNKPYKQGTVPLWGTSAEDLKLLQSV